ncbi:MAG: hypothetical protein FWF92_04970 [Oscillospiraceae bacterium]|nr:hypothetical protein [Oscillospiraceae bacterium]
MKIINEKKLLCRVIFLFVIIIMLAAALSSCGSNSGGDTENKDKNESQNDAQKSDDEIKSNEIPEPLDVEENDTDTDSRAGFKDSLPDNLDFGGAEYRALVRADGEYNCEFAEDEIGEVVNDALYRRQIAVEDRLNVKIVPVKRLGNWENQNQFLSPMKASIKAGSDDYDIIAGYAYYITPFALDGNFLNLAEFANIDYEKPWWPDSITTNLKIADKLYFITGDYTLTLIRSLNCLFFNKDLAQDYAVPNLYQLVLDGEWTFDKYDEIVRNVSKDLNGDGKYDLEDLYGLVTRWYDVYFAAFQLPLSKTESDGTLQVDVYNEKFVDAYNKIYDLTHGDYALHVKYLNEDATREQTLFANNQALFLGRNLEICETLRDMTAGYGILPYPKYDKAQDNYYTVSHDDYSLLSIPVTADPNKYNMIGAVTEALAADGYRTVTPAYFEIALKNKYSRDDESSQMLDILVGGNTFQPAIIYSGSLGNIGHLMREMQNDAPDITSIYEKKAGAYQKAFDKFNDKFSELN